MTKTIPQADLQHGFPVSNPHSVPVKPSIVTVKKAAEFWFMSLKGKSEK